MSTPAPMATLDAALPRSILSVYLEYKNEHQPRFTRWLAQQVWERKRNMEDRNATGANGGRWLKANKKGRGGGRGGSTEPASASTLRYRLKNPSPLPDPFPLSDPDIPFRLSDLSLLSRFLSNLDPGERVPEGIILLLESIIAGRRLVSRHYQNSRHEQPSDQDRSHNHATNVFSSILEILKSCGPSAEREEVRESTVAVIPFFSLRGAEATDVETAVEDPNEWVPAQHRVVMRNKLGKRQVELEPAQMLLSRFLLQSDDEESDRFEEAQLAAFCFLLDAERLSNLVRETWVEYATHSLTLATATLVTNHSLAFLKESEASLLEIYQDIYTIGDHNQIVSVMMGYRDPMSFDQLPEILMNEKEGTDEKDLRQFVRASSFAALSQWGTTLAQNTGPADSLPTNAAASFAQFNPLADREEMTSCQQDDEDFALVCNKLNEIALVSSSTKPPSLLSEEALYLDTARYLKDPAHLIPTHLLLQWDFWLHSVHACRRDLDRPCTKALATVASIVAAAEKWLQRPQLNIQCIGATNFWRNELKHNVVKRLTDEYQPDSPPTTLLREAYISANQPGRAHDLPQYNDLRLSPWASGCLQIESLHRGHSNALVITKESGYLSSALHLYHCLRLHKQLHCVPFVDSLFTQCVPNLYGTSSPPTLGQLAYGLLATLDRPDGKRGGYLPEMTGTSLIAQSLLEDGRYTVSDALRKRVADAQAATSNSQRDQSDLFLLLGVLRDIYEKDIAESTLTLDLFALESLAVDIFERWHTLANVTLGLTFGEVFGTDFDGWEREKSIMTGFLVLSLERRDRLTPPVSEEAAQDLLKTAAQAFKEAVEAMTMSLGSGMSVYYAGARDK